MAKRNTAYSLLLVAGDALFLIIALWLTLFLRYGTWPTESLLVLHLIPFTYIFLSWLLIYFIYDLYRWQISLFHQRLAPILLNAHIVNSIIAIVFFYLIPYFEITPKTILFIFLFISFGGLVIWRTYLVPRLFNRDENSILFACESGAVDELAREFQNNGRHNMKVLGVGQKVTDSLATLPKNTLIAISGYHGSGANNDFRHFYPLLFSGFRFVSAEELYEDLFGRVPLSLISERWFLEHVSTHPKLLYDFLKRLVDVVVGVVFGVLSLVFYPFIALLIKLDDGGSIFFKQVRIGRGGKIFTVYKFRSMKDGRVSRFGRFLRVSRLDELPQLWNIIKGDVSLVGPRPELVEYVDRYRVAIPYYDIRHLIAPGLSGWAQIYHENHPHFAPEIDATREKLSYDLFYIKNRSLLLDLKILLKTIRIVLSQKGK